MEMPTKYNIKAEDTAWTGLTVAIAVSTSGGSLWMDGKTYL